MQIVLDVVRHGFIKISDFNLIVFDECHNATKEHPMRVLMTMFANVPESQHPRVLGLTGMLTAHSIKPQNVIEDLNRLESTFRSQITTAKGDSFSDVLLHSTSPEEEILHYETHFMPDFGRYISYKVKVMLETINNWPLDDVDRSDKRLEKQSKPSKKYESICKDFEYQINNLGN